MNDFLIKYIKENFFHPLAFLSGCVLLLILFASLDTFFDKILPYFTWRLLIYFIVLIIWAVYWFHERNKWPKAENGKVGIVFCIDTENNKQKIRIKSDLVERMEKLVEANSLSDQIDILLIKPNKTDKFLKIIRSYNRKRNQLIRSGSNISNEKEIRVWNKTLNRINGHFFIWGEIKERKNNESRYYFELDSLVTHKPLTFGSQAFLKTEMMNIWANSISFKEQFEFDGFKLSTDIIYLAVKYITGIAAFLSGDPFLAVKLHNNLENEINSFKPIPKNLESVKKKLKLLLSEEYVIMGRTYNQANKFKEAKQSLAKAIKVNKDGYAVNLFKSIIDFQDGNPNESLKSIRIAKNNAGHDGTWRYNEGFVLMFLEKWPEAMKTYNKISATSYFNEEDTLNQVLNFNKNQLKNNPKYLQSLFIIGFLNLKKLNNYPEAYEYFDKFIDESNNIPKYNYLLKIAYSYMDTIKSRMKLT